MLENGSINPGEMTSFNHYALGAIADWMHRSLAGLAPASPGYRELLIAPQLVAGFEHATASHETPYGPASSGWSRVDASSVLVEATVPPNATAEVWLPRASEALTVGSGSHSWTVHAPATDVARGDVSLDTDLASIIDDPEAYAAIGATIAENDEDAARVFRTHTTWAPGRSLGGVMFQLPPAVQEKIGAALAELSAARR